MSDDENNKTLSPLPAPLSRRRGGREISPPPPVPLPADAADAGSRPKPSPPPPTNAYSCPGIAVPPATSPPTKGSAPSCPASASPPDNAPDRAPGSAHNDRSACHTAGSASPDSPAPFGPRKEDPRRGFLAALRASSPHLSLLTC